MGTLPLDQCMNMPGADNEPLPDAWPFDFNDDKVATLADVLRYIGRIYVPAMYDVRNDFTANGTITLADVLQYIGMISKTCTP